MTIFRNTYFRDVMTVFTAVIFLNMSFFLAEVSALKLHQDKELIANIAKLLSTSASEEERDVFGATDEDHTSRVVDLIFSYSVHTVHNNTVDVNSKRCVKNEGLTAVGNYEIFSPPPEA